MEPESTPPQVPPAPSEPSLKQIRTYEGDIAAAIKKQNESLVSIQTAEHARKEARRTLGPQESQPVEASEGGGKRALVMALLTIVLIGLGGTGSYYAWSAYSEKTAPPIAQVPANQLVRATTAVRVDASTLGRAEMLGTITKERGKLRGLSDIEQIDLRRGSTPESESLDTAGFLTRIASRAPSSLVRAFNPTFMLGILGSTPSHTFIIIRLNSFENAFPGMLDWEPKLAEDVLPLIAGEIILDGIPISAEFSDITIQNQDARIFKDGHGKTVLLYAFFDNELLVITDNEDTFRTLVGRLESQKLIR